MNASNSPKLALPKPRTAGKKMRVRPRPISAKRRAEKRLVSKVFAEIEPRDGPCRLQWWLGMPWMRELLGDCWGDPTPAHLGPWRRGTCKLPPEERSTRKTIIRACEGHHRRYDEHEFDLAIGPDGADGLLQPEPYVKGAA